MASLAETQIELSAVREASNQSWLLLGAFLVLFMQAGFAMLEVGLCRAKNTKSILLKNFLDSMVGMIVYFLWGFSFEFGSSNGFIGGSEFYALKGVSNFANFLFQFAFAATTATIVSGAMAERTKVSAYLVYSTTISGFIFPVVGHWLWSSFGWLNYGNAAVGTGAIDFAGSGAVHLCGAVCSLVGVIMVGARKGRFSAEGLPRPMPGHSIVLSTLGCFILMLGWCGFNAGVTATIPGGIAEHPNFAGRVAVNTSLGGAAGALSIMILSAFSSTHDLSQVLNGVLVGFVSVTGPSGVIEPWAAVVIGAIAPLGLLQVQKLLLRFQLDDPVDAIPVHGGGGILGILASGFFAVPKYAEAAYGPGMRGGIFYGDDGTLLSAQIVTILAITAFSAVVGWIALWLCKVTVGVRVSEFEEMQGLDSKLGGSAYPDFYKPSTKSKMAQPSLPRSIFS
eukprot:TRINITY_DN1236_c0_g1_i4.p1 TRINITY_DN1236_c0_g1~~TRINITY_DN1236_c0_g1_i4.p1  ORF type:complete len:451 (-),score=76.71 TRINITY_DN1236_c0_g1_i4:24-1376(-)